MSDFKVGMIVKPKGSKIVGRIVYIHKIDEPDLIVDFGQHWNAYFSIDVKVATPKQAEAFNKNALTK